MFFSGQYINKNQQANEVDATSDEKTKAVDDSNTCDKMSQPLITIKGNETTTTKTKGSSSTALPSSSTPFVNNKRKIVEDDKVGDDERNNEDVTVLPKKPKNNDTDDTNTCKRERWPVVNYDIEVDLFCVQGWRDELCRCGKV